MSKHTIEQHYQHQKQNTVTPKALDEAILAEAGVQPARRTWLPPLSAAAAIVVCVTAFLLVRPTPPHSYEVAINAAQDTTAYEAPAAMVEYESERLADVEIASEDVTDEVFEADAFRDEAPTPSLPSAKVVPTESPSIVVAAAPQSRALTETTPEAPQAPISLKAERAPEAYAPEPEATAEIVASKEVQASRSLAREQAPRPSKSLNQWVKRVVMLINGNQMEMAQREYRALKAAYPTADEHEALKPHLNKLTAPEQ